MASLALHDVLSLGYCIFHNLREYLIVVSLLTDEVNLRLMRVITLKLASIA